MGAAGLNFYKHHLGDYDSNTAHLSWDEDMAYTRLMRIYYRREAPLPIEPAELYRLARGVTSKQKQAISAVLSEFFSKQEDGWHNKRCDEEIAAYQSQASTNRRIARQRFGHEPLTNRDEIVNLTINQNQNHKPEEEKKGASRFSPPSIDEVKIYCADRKNKVNPETFVDFYAAKGWKVGNQPMKDWKACVRTWEKREQFTPKNGNGSVPPITDERGLESYGAKLGIRPRAGESWTQFRSRVMAAA